MRSSTRVEEVRLFAPAEALCTLAPSPALTTQVSFVRDTLVGMGFDEQAAMQALMATSGDVDEAALLLFAE